MAWKEEDEAERTDGVNEMVPRHGDTRSDSEKREEQREDAEAVKRVETNVRITLILTLIYS